MNHRVALGCRLHLAWWLSPASPVRGPAAHHDVTLVADATGQPFPLHVYRPFHGPIRGSWFLLHGLHHQGAEHPQIDRLARVLASAGFLVGAPSLPDFVRLACTERVLDDAERAWTSFQDQRHGAHKPTAIMSVSLGALPALALAAGRAPQVAGLLTFGGYIDWKAVMNWVIDDAPDKAYDPRNLPVLYKLLHPCTPHEAMSLHPAWTRWLKATWSWPDIGTREARQHEAQQIADTLPAPLRAPFLEGCGDQPRSRQRAADLINQTDNRTWMNLRPYAAALTCPLVTLHARSDSISPASQSAALRTAAIHAPWTEGIVTGLVDHSGEQPLSVSRLTAPIHELRNLHTTATSMCRLAGVGLT